MATSRNGQTLYDRFRSGEVGSQELEPATLFELATQAGVRGDYADQGTIYEKIFSHQQATDDDRTRVLIYRFDQQRRHGNPQQALESLRRLKQPTDPIAKGEWLQAIGQCELMIHGPSTALETQREAISLFDMAGVEVPVDKKLYRLESAIAMKLQLKQADDELDGYFARYQELLDHPSLEGKVKTRAFAAFYSVRASAYEMKGEVNLAKELYLKYFTTAPAVRDKVVAVLRYLACTWRNDPDDQSQQTRDMTTFFKDHLGELQATDIDALKEEYSLVSNKIMEVKISP